MLLLKMCWCVEKFNQERGAYHLTWLVQLKVLNTNIWLLNNHHIISVCLFSFGREHFIFNFPKNKRSTVIIRSTKLNLHLPLLTELLPKPIKSWVEQNVSRADGGGLDGRQSSPSDSLPSTYLFSYVNKTRAAASTRPCWPGLNHSLIILIHSQRASSGANIQMCLFKAETLTSLTCDIININDQRWAKAGVWLQFIHHCCSLCQVEEEGEWPDVMK